MTVLTEQFLFELGPLAKEAFRARYNIAPTQETAAVRLVDGRRQLAMLHFGLIPSWSESATLKFNTINARADTVASKGTFRSAYKHRRCLVLADGFYEWQTVEKSRLPWLYEVEGGQPFAFAGIWEAWRPKKTYAWESFALITTEANELVSRIHTRMPVILDPADYDAWLAGKEIPLVPFPAERMAARAVSTFVNSAQNEGPECVELKQ